MKRCSPNMRCLHDGTHSYINIYATCVSPQSTTGWLSRIGLSGIESMTQSTGGFGYARILRWVCVRANAKDTATMC